MPSHLVQERNFSIYGLNKTISSPLEFQLPVVSIFTENLCVRTVLADRHREVNGKTWILPHTAYVQWFSNLSNIFCYEIEVDEAYMCHTLPEVSSKLYAILTVLSQTPPILFLLGKC